MRQFTAVLACALLAACHRPTEVRGIYVNADTTGTLFPCDDPKVSIAVQDSTLRAVGNKPVFVRLRGVKGHAGSIYGGQRFFQVQQILEVRSRATGECPGVAESITPYLPDR
jgi:hypothetical protein